MTNTIHNDMANSMNDDVRHITNGIRCQQQINDRMGWMDTQVIIEHVRAMVDSATDQATVFILLAGMPDEALDGMVDCTCTPTHDCRNCDMRARATQGLNIPDLDW